MDRGAAASFFSPFLQGARTNKKEVYISVWTDTKNTCSVFGFVLYLVWNDRCT